MRILIGCEFSGTVRDAFRARGHDAISADLIESERPGPHIIGDIRDLLGDGWDMAVMFPPCTCLAASGNRWYAGTAERRQAAEFVKDLAAAAIPRIAIENPVGALSVLWRRPDLIIHPWEYGAAETKATCLWLKGLPPLMVEEHVTGRLAARVHRESPGPERWKRRSRTYPGIAAAMARQWGLAPPVRTAPGPTRSPPTATTDHPPTTPPAPAPPAPARSAPSPAEPAAPHSTGVSHPPTTASAPSPATLPH
jgi:hypothetical protein